MESWVSLRRHDSPQTLLKECVQGSIEKKKASLVGRVLMAQREVSGLPSFRRDTFSVHFSRFIPVLLLVSKQL